MSQTQATKTQLVITTENTRFAGQGYDFYDPTPYGDAIEKMYESMLETYRKTGSLLLQPVVVEEANEAGEHPVRAGYTRALTFITRYDDLCRELCTNVTLPIIVFTEIDEVDAMMENSLRTSQNYISMAHTIEKVMSAKKMTPVKIATQLGIKPESVVRLRKMVSFPEELKRMCYRGIITQEAAEAMTTLSFDTQVGVCNYIEQEHIAEVKTQHDVLKLVRYTLPIVDRHCPVEEFTDPTGRVFPHISEEEWCISLGIGTYHYKKEDKDLMTIRTFAYNKLIESQVGDVKPKDKYRDYAYSSAWRQVQPGTHPNEIAVWNDTGVYIEFYLRNADWDKMNNHSKVTELQKEKALDRGKLATVQLADSVKLELMREEMRYRYHLAATDHDAVILHTFEVLFARMDSTQKKYLNKFVGFEVTTINIDTIDPDKMLLVFSYAILMGTSSVYSTHKRFFKDNDIDWEKMLKDKQKSIESEKHTIMVEAKDKAERITDTQADIVGFVRDMQLTVVAGSDYTLYDLLMTDVVMPEQLLKFIAKGIGQPYKGDRGINQKRLRNYVGQLAKAYEIEQDDNTEMLSSLREACTVDMTQHESVASLYDSKVLSGIVNTMMQHCVQAGIAKDTIFDRTITYTDAMKHASNMEATLCIQSLQAQVYHKVLIPHNLKVISLSGSGKVLILA